MDGIGRLMRERFRHVWGAREKTRYSSLLLPIALVNLSLSPRGALERTQGMGFLFTETLRLFSTR